MARRYKGILFPDTSFETPEHGIPGQEGKAKKKAKKPAAKPIEETETLSSSDLSKMKKAQVEEEAEKLGIDITDKTKKELVEEILNTQ